MDDPLKQWHGYEPIKVADFRRIAAEKVSLHFYHRTGIHDLLNRAEFDIAIDRAAMYLIVKMNTHLLAMPRERIDIEERWPSDWWQAFKDRWFPAWALKRWPVQYKTISVHERRYGNLCPHINIPQHNTHVEFMMREES